MTRLRSAVDDVLKTQKQSKKPLAVIVAGHNGSGKSTMWYADLADKLRIPLVNADRMMMSILPETNPLPHWASELRNTNQGWMIVAQKGVEAFVAQAMAHGVPFAMETVFSHWKKLRNGRVESKIGLITEMQAAGYFVLLFFVGLASCQLSIARVATRVAQGGHDVDTDRLTKRFPRTQKTIRIAATLADAAILVDNSRERKQAFTVCRVQMKAREIYDIRNGRGQKPAEILAWLSVVAPHVP